MRRVSVATTIMPGYDHVSGLERLRGPVTVIRRCEDLAELISVARSGLADAVLVAGDTELLTRTAIGELADGRAGDRAVAVVALSAVAVERERLDGLGIPVASPEVEAPELAALLLEATARTAAGDPVGTPTRPRRLGGGGRTPEGSAEATDPATSPFAHSTPAHSPGGAPGTSPDPTPAAGPPMDPDGQAASARPVGPGTEADPDARSDTALWDTALSDTARARDSAADGVPDGRVDSRVDGSVEGSVDGWVDGDAAAAGPSRVTAVWGPAGSPGRTTVAVNLAVELALSGRRTLLVDLDTYAAAAGVHLGLLEESAGIAQACRLAERGGVTADGLERAAVGVRVAGATLRVLTGLTRADRWPELRRAAVADVLATAASAWDEVVVDCGFCLEEDEELSFDVPAPQRNAATLAGLAAADRVIAVGTGDAVGLPRLIRGLDELDRCLGAPGPGGTGPIDGTTVEVVVNQVRSDASGVAPRAQIGSVVEQFGGDRSVVAYLPWDRRSLDRALLGGQVLAEAAPSSALRRALAGLVRLPGDPGASRPRGRWTGAGRRLLGALRGE